VLNFGDINVILIIVKLIGNVCQGFVFSASNSEHGNFPQKVWDFLNS